MKGLPRWLNQMWLNPWVGKIPWSRKQQPIPVFLSGKSHGERGLTGYRINRVGNDLATKQQHVVKASQHSSEHNQNLLLTCEFMCANSSHFQSLQIDCLPTIPGKACWLFFSFTVFRFLAPYVIFLPNGFLYYANLVALSNLSSLWRFRETISLIFTVNVHKVLASLPQ